MFHTQFTTSSATNGMAHRGWRIRLSVFEKKSETRFFFLSLPTISKTGTINMTAKPMYPMGLVIKACVKSPLAMDISARVDPQEGQATPVAFLNMQTVVVASSGLNTFQNIHR